MQNFFKKYGYGILLGLIFLLGVLLRLKGLLSNPSLWHDECALAWNVKYKNYGDFFGILRFMQMAPPFFMILTKLTTNIFGISDFSLRILPFLAGVASIIAFYFLAQKTLKSKAVVLWAVFFFAINQRMINYSFEFKPYSFDVLLAIICLLFFINLDLEKLKRVQENSDFSAPSNTKKAALYGVLLSVVPWFSFTSVFVIAGGILNILFKSFKNKNKTVLFPLSFFLFPLVISGLIYLKIYLFNNYTGTHMVNYWQDSFLNFNPIFFFYMLIYNIRYFFTPMPFALFAFILFFLGIKILGKEKSVFVEIFSKSMILLILASLLHIYPFSTRLILFLLPMFLLLILKPLDLTLYAKKIKLFGVLLLMFFTFYPQVVSINQFIHLKNISRGEHPREIMEILIKKLKSDDKIFVANFSNTEFAYYSSFHNIKNQIIQEPQKINHEEFLNSLEKNKNYWFYLTFEDSKVIKDWISRNAQKIKLIYQNRANDYLIYAYIK